MERVFRALSEGNRRQLLDRLYERDGQTVTELDAALPDVTRFATMKHLRVLEEAGLVATRRVGREKRHFLNPVPIRLVHDRWIRKYAEPLIATMSRVKRNLEEGTMSKTRVATASQKEGLTHVYEVMIQATPEQIWKALTDSTQTKQYFHGSTVETTWEPGARIEYRIADGKVAIEGELIEVEPNRRFSHTWHALWDERISAEPPSKVTWEITPMGDVCRLSVIHSELGPEAREQISSGYVYIVSGLKSLLETGKPLTGVSM